MWNERRLNGWLFLELMAVSIFLWLAIDPLFILMSRDRIPPGYRAENLYKVEMIAYKKTNLKYRPRPIMTRLRLLSFATHSRQCEKFPKCSMWVPV